MKHIFNIRTQTVQGKICNKKIFNLKVAGLSIMISWPLVPIKTSFKHIAASGTPWIKTNITHVPLHSQVRLFFEIVKSNIRIRITPNKRIYFKTGTSLVSRIKTRFMELNSSFICSVTETVNRMKIQLFGSGQAFQNVAVSHEGTANCGRFYKLSDWDYNTEGNERLLNEIDNMNISDMDMIIN